MAKAKNIFKYIFIFIVLLTLCIVVNKNLIIKGLYKDDLYNWSWFPGMNALDFSFGFYSESRYRPFFNIVQYLEYVIVANKPIIFTYFNYVTNSLLALFIFHFASKLKAGNLISFLISALFIISHFAYYQIGQVFGLLETESQFFALLILFLCFKITGIIENIHLSLTIIIMYLVFFVVSFTHERYLCLMPLILVSLIMAKGHADDKEIIRTKFLSILIFIFTLFIIAGIRYVALGKIIPAGTGGTSVEETFNFIEVIKNCFKQLFMIFGINIGPEHLVGAEFSAIPNVFTKFFGILSIASIIIIFAIYLMTKIHFKDEKKTWLPDILFVLFIVSCIGASSVTIRIEMRFIYVSFTASLLYLSYVCGYIFDKKNKFFTLLFFILTIFFVAMRTPIELRYRKYYNKVHCIVDQMMMNSLYDNTIGVYGVDDILHNKKIYILNNLFGMTDFYAEYFYKIYDKENIGNKIVFINSIAELPNGSNNDNSIVLIEDMVNNAYVRYNIS